MPTSRMTTIPYVMSAVKQLAPTSILDVGVGFGKWGYLFRETADIVPSETDPDRYAKPGWKTRIEGIESHGRYLHDAMNYIYDEIYVGDAAKILPALGSYDLIFFGDIIEHMPKDVGRTLLTESLQHAKQAVLLTTPRFEIHPGPMHDNPRERHECVWSAKDFRAIGDCRIALADRLMYVVAYPKPGAPKFDLQPKEMVRAWPIRFLKTLLGR